MCEGHTIGQIQQLRRGRKHLRRELRGALLLLLRPRRAGCEDLSRLLLWAPQSLILVRRRGASWRVVDTEVLHLLFVLELCEYDGDDDWSIDCCLNHGQLQSE